MLFVIVDPVMTRYRRSVARVIIEQAFLPQTSLIQIAREIEHSIRVALIGLSEMAWKHSRSEITPRLVISTPPPNLAGCTAVYLSRSSSQPSSEESWVINSATPQPGCRFLVFLLLGARHLTSETCFFINKSTHRKLARKRSGRVGSLKDRSRG